MGGINQGRILYEDEYLLAVHKLPQELVVRGAGPVGKLPLLDFLRKEYPGVRPIHRLDFDTSGVVLFARRKDVLEEVLKCKFSGWSKTYRAIVAGRIMRSPGVISAPLPGHQKGEFVPAETRYTVLRVLADCSYVEATIEKGRHHQIRRHFAGMHHALALDAEYGDPRFNSSFTRKYGYRRFFLHALKVEFPHPMTGVRVTITSPLPPVFEQALAHIARGGVWPDAGTPTKGRR